MQIGRWIALAIIGTASTASADDVTRADQLFAEGKTLMETDLHAGCDKLQQSLALNAQAIGTLLNVALCDVRLGRLATAAEHFTLARDIAREQGLREHLEAAEAHLLALAPRVPHVTFKLAENLPETKILVRDKLLPSTGWVEAPLDPGEHTIVISAPGRVTFRTTLRIAEGERHDVVVPALAKASSSSRATVGKVTLVAGAGMFATGVVLGFVAGRRYDTAREGCLVNAGVVSCNDASYDAINSARAMGTAGTVVGAVGLVAAGVGGYLWLRSPRRRAETSITFVPQVGAEGGGIAAVGRF